MKGNKVEGIDQDDDTFSNTPRLRFSNKWKFPSWGSAKKMKHSSTIENGLNAMFFKVSEQRKPRSATDNAVNNSLVSLGFAVANTNTRDLHQVRCIKMYNSFSEQLQTTVCHNKRSWKLEFKISTFIISF